MSDSVVGAGFGLAGDVLGGIFSSRESRKKRKEAARQFNEQMDFQKNATQYRVNDALKAGINPLAALGVSSNVSPTISSYGGDNSIGESASRVGDRLSDFFNRLTTREASDTVKYNREARELDLESKRIQNQIDRARLGAMGQPGVPEQDSSPEGTDILLYRPVYDIEGRPRLMINQDVTENDSDNAGYRSSLATAVASGQINPVTGRIVSHQLRMKIADDYERATGRPLSNWEEMYISPTELGLVTLDEIRGR